MTTEVLAAAWEEGRVECPPCPVCGKPIPPTSEGGTSVRTDMEDVYDMAPLWPGGPMVEASLWPTDQRVTGVWWKGPCGHEFDTLRREPRLVWTVHHPRTSDTPAPVGSSV